MALSNIKLLKEYKIRHQNCSAAWKCPNLHIEMYFELTSIYHLISHYYLRGDGECNFHRQQKSDVISVTFARIYSLDKYFTVVWLSFIMTQSCKDMYTLYRNKYVTKLGHHRAWVQYCCRTYAHHDLKCFKCQSVKWSVQCHCFRSNGCLRSHHTLQ